MQTLAQTSEMVFDLRPKFKVGQQARYSLWTKRNTATQITLMGKNRQQASSYIVEGDATWSVLAVNADGSAQCQMVFDWFSLTLTLPDGTTQNNDTRDGTADNPQVYPVLQAMVAKPIEVAMAADGSVKSVAGTDAMRASVAEEVDIPEDLDFIESASDLATLPFAPTQVSVGQSWETAYRWSHELGHMNHAVNYTLSSVRNIAGIDLATVTGNGILTLDMNQDKMPPQQDGVQIDLSLEEGTVQHQVLIDMDRHEAVGRNSLMTTRIRTTMDNGQNSIAQVTTETVQSQALRISETDPVQ
mgnify:CR=1 FL=1|tara:strand:+ start:675 stop:1577 length:903 start_codon:yes stop_codon:yes gene_type:complete